MSENLKIDFHFHFKKSPTFKSKCWKETGNRGTYLRCGRHSVIIEFVACEHRQNGAHEWEILSHARQRFLGTDQLSLFIEALVIVLPINVGIDAGFANFLLLTFTTPLKNLIIQISSQKKLFKKERKRWKLIFVLTHKFSIHKRPNKMQWLANSRLISYKEEWLHFVCFSYTHFCLSTCIKWVRDK